MKKLTRPRLESLRRDASDPLEEAWESARDARDIIRDRQRRERRSLPEYTGEDEDTARHDAPATHVHLHQYSSKPDTDPQIEIGPVKVRGLPKWVVVGVGLALAGGTALVAHFAR